MALQPRYTTITDLLGVRFRVIKAILIRDMRTRFGRTHLAYIVAIAWPLSHLLGIVIGFSMVNRMLPFGSDSVMFISTGALPYILCLYPARMMAFALVHNLSALGFPIVSPIDVIVARMILEALTAFAVVIIFVFGLWAVDFDIVPQDIPTAFTAIYATIFFGLSIGSFAMILRALLKTPGYIVFILSMIGLYLSSGVMIPVIPTGDLMRTLIGLNPIYQLVQWMRSAYFETHTAVPLDKSYILLLSAFLMLMGLLGERLFRGKVIVL